MASILSGMALAQCHRLWAPKKGILAERRKPLATTVKRYRYSLFVLFMFVSVLGLWLGAYSHSPELFWGLGLLIGSVGWGIWRHEWLRGPRAAHVATNSVALRLHEDLLAMLSFLGGLGLVISHFAQR